MEPHTACVCIELIENRHAELHILVCWQCRLNACAKYMPGTVFSALETGGSVHKGQVHKRLTFARPRLTKINIIVIIVSPSATYSSKVV